MNYPESVHDALNVLNENLAGVWLRLRQADLSVVYKSGKAHAVARRLMGGKVRRPKQGTLGLGSDGVYIFHRDRWRRAIQMKNGKFRLEGSL